MFFKRPLISAPKPPADPASPAGATTSFGPPARPAAPAGAVVLVVDDSAMIRSSVAKTLAAQGYEILEADDGVNGLAAWEKHRARISIVLSDVFMPRMDGLAMARELRRRSRTLPIALMSSKLDEDSRWIAEEAGFRLLPKPFKDTYLIELIARMLKLRNAG